MRNERRRIKEINLLSAYLDNALNAKQKQQLEQRLLVEPALQAKLQHLNQTKILMQRAAAAPCPPQFHLDSRNGHASQKKETASVQRFALGYFSGCGSTGRSVWRGLHSWWGSDV